MKMTFKGVDILDDENCILVMLNMFVSLLFCSFPFYLSAVGSNFASV